MTLKPPAVTATAVAPATPRGYPGPYAHVTEGRTRRALGDALGLTQFGVNYTELAPGGMSSLRHWHTGEDELVFVLSGEVVLVTEAGEQTLRAGDCAGFPANSGDGHHLQNRSSAPAAYLEIGHRSAAEEVHYVDADLHLVRGEGWREFRRKDGTPY